MGDLPPDSVLGAALRSHLAIYSHIHGDLHEANQSLQRLELVSKSLNVSPNYATHFRSGIRELVQNWHDQCKVAAGSHGVLEVHDLTPAAAAAGDLLLAATTGGRCCGYLSLTSAPGAAADSCDVRLCNYGSTVSMAAMTLGESSKRDHDSLAGYFGEGAKVEINRITASGASVTYYTSNQEWTFRYDREMDSEVLYLHSRRLSYTPSGKTVVVVQRAQRAWFKRENYLFLYRTPYARYSGTGKASQVELLPEAEHAGRLYVHGFFVSQDKSLPLHGLNFCGSRTSLLSMGFGRDRNSVQASSMVQLVPQLFVELKGDEAKQRALARLLCIVLDKHPSSAWREVWLAPGDRAMADAMYHVFWEEHSQNAIPVDNSNAQDSADFEYLGMQAVKVSYELFRVLIRSKHHPTLDQLWERHYHKLLTIPDYGWREADEADRYRYTLICTLVATFPKYLNPDRMSVKALPPGNGNIIVAVRRSSPDGGRAAATQAVYVIDVTALSQDEVHRRLKKSDPYFECDPQNCACLPIALEDAAIAAISKAQGISEYRLRAELRRAQHRHHGLGWRGTMPAPPEPPPMPAGPQPMHSSEQEPAAHTPHEQGGAGQSGAADDGQPASSSSWGPATPGRAASPAAAEAESGPPADPHVQLLDGASLDAGVHGSLHPSVAQQRHRVHLERPTNGQAAGAAAAVPARDCRNSRGTLVQTAIDVGGTLIFMPQDIVAVRVPDAQIQRWRSLFALLNGMHCSVFLQGQSSTAAFCLYYDPKDDAIAFNLGRPGEAGECWYNAAYDPPDADPVARAKHWFLTTCHELAHNFVRAHNSAFADVMGQIVLRYAGRFRAMYVPAV